MEFTAKKTDEANAVVTATLSADLLANTLDKIAKEASKTMDIQGFRKGKVPVAVVKQRYGAKLEEDANSEALRELYSASLKDLGLEQGDIIGEPAITKFDKKDDSSIDVQINISCKPTVDLGDYKA